ncbi:MAG: fluoride efflux transporter CrcB [Chloroflexi bacterium]|nr:MAG: fluoride efflux transporter CrcB [Chloroflexota bacterium]
MMHGQQPEKNVTKHTGKRMWGNQVLAIGLGAVLGANARYLVALWAAARFGLGFPYGTLIVNMTGSLILGFLVTVMLERLSVPPEVRLFLVVGFLGSFTTFSSFAVESLGLLQNGAAGKAIVNIFANNALSLACALLGVYLARLINQ